MTLRQVLLEGTRALRDAGIDGPERDARLLLAEILGLSVSRLSLEPDFRVSDAQIAQFHAFLARRAAAEPVSRILGRRNFWGRDFEITPDVLDPRPETETLIDLALSGAEPETLIDLGCGSGILAVTLLAEWPMSRGTATDVSDACLQVTASNAKLHKVHDRLDVKKSNWFSDICGVFDLIVSNPPYITQTEMTELAPDVIRFDPHLALTPGGDGLSCYRALAEQAKAHLAPGGRMLLEIGWKQSADVQDILRSEGYQNVQCHDDLNGHARVVSAHHD